MANEELLTHEEMSALLPETPADEASIERERRKRVVPYNFRRPDRLSKEHVRALYLLHDQFANNLTSSLPLFLRTVCEVTLISVEQQSYSDYLKGLTDPTTLSVFSVRPLGGVFAIELSPSVAFPIVDRMLGGDGAEAKELRPATELELKVLEGFLAVIVGGYRDVWKPHADLETEITGRETRPQMLQIVPPNEVVATVAYQIQIGDAKGSMSMCLPVALLEPIAEGFGRSAYEAGHGTPPETTAALLSTIAGVRFSVTCDMESVAVPVSELTSLSPGDVLHLSHPVEKTLNICVGGHPKFNGKLGSLDGRLVVQLTESNAPNLNKVAG